MSLSSGSSPSRSKVPAGLLGMLVLVLAVESFVAHRWLDFNDPISLCWRTSGADTRRAAPGCDVLILGDSLAKHGLVPALVESRSGLRSWNLASVAGPSPFSYFLFRRALESGARPRAVVVDFNPAFLGARLDLNLRYWQESLTPRELIELCRAGGGSSFAARMALGRLLPTVRGRLEVRSNVFAALRGEHDRLYAMNRILSENWRRNGGANIVPRNPAFTGELSPEAARQRTDRWFHERVNLDYVTRLVHLAADRGIQVYWLLPPLTPQLQERREGSAAEEGYLTFVRDIARDHPNVTVLDTRHAGYPNRVFSDSFHLDRQGALALSLDVGDVLRRERAAVPLGGHWVDMPRYRERSAEISLEDVQETKVALTNQGTLKD